MSYETETIDQAEKKNVFTNRLDPDALRIDPDTRKRMYEQLRQEAENLRLITEDEEHDLSKSPPSRRHERRRRSLWQILREAFLFIIYGGRGGMTFRSSSRSRSKTRHVLDSFQGGIYDFRQERVLEAFANYMFRIYVGIRPLQVLFRDAFRAVEEIDPEVESVFMRFVSELLTPSTQELLSRFSIEHIQQIHDYDDKARLVMERDLDRFEERFYEVDYKSVVSKSRLLEILIGIAQFDWTAFFIRFDREFDPTLKRRPNFSACHMALIESEIRDLANLCYPLYRIPDIPEMKRHVFEVLYLVRHGEQKDTDYANESFIADGSLRYLPLREIPVEVETIDYSMEMLNSLVHNVNALNREEILIHLMRYGTPDREFEPDEHRREIDFATRYLEIVRYQTFGVLEHIEKQTTKRRLDERVCDYLGLSEIRELPMLRYYDRLTVEKLMAKNMDTFMNHTMEYAVASYFARNWFRGRLQKLIDTFLIEGNFSDNRRRSDWAGKYKLLDETVSSMLEWEQGMKDVESEDAKTIARYLEGILSESQHKSMVRTRIENLNNEAVTFIDKLKSNIRELLSFVEQCANDVESTSPKLLMNAKDLSTTLVKQQRMTIRDMYLKLSTMPALLDEIADHAAIYEPAYRYYEKMNKEQKQEATEQTYENVV